MHVWKRNILSLSRDILIWLRKGTMSGKRKRKHLQQKRQQKRQEKQKRMRHYSLPGETEDYVRWNRKRTTATMEEVDGQTTVESVDDLELEWTDFNLSNNNQDRRKAEVKALLKKTGLL